ncbi:MAG: response regulator transcription factor [Saprospiraceae bacterium]|nr:response regulator transcription factor [Saprospiraceae bacterium]
MRVLLIEDEASLRQVLKINLELESYEVIEAEDGLDAKTKVENEHFDIILLDLMLPHINGMDLLEMIRINNDKIPVIITSAKDTSSDRIKGLKTGADDYITKPFEIEELLLRMEKLLQRTVPANSQNVDLESFVFGDKSVNFRTFKGTHGQKSFDLSTKEIQLLKLLIGRKNEVVSRHDILKQVWGYDVFPSTRTIDNFIASLRKRFESDPKHPEYILSVRGIGYKFQFNPE